MRQRTRPATDAERVSAEEDSRSEVPPNPVGDAVLERLAVLHQNTHVPAAGLARMAAAAGNRAIAALLREPAPSATPTPDAGTATPDAGIATADAGAGTPDAGTTAAPAWATEDLKRTMTAVILAESAPGQESDIRWMYLQRVTAKGGAAGLNASSAYKAKGIWFKIWLQILGDETYADTVLPANKKEFADFKEQTVADFCAKNGYIEKYAVPRATALREDVDKMFTSPEDNPYKGWDGQGNLADFNNESNKDVYWKRARAYYWLQQRNEVKETLVKVLADGKKTQVIFNGKAIDAYWRKHTLPDDVPKYTP